MNDDNFKPQILRKQRVLSYDTPYFKIRLLGTNHFEEESTALVAQALTQVQPHIVTVELCRERIEQANLLGLSRSKFEHKYKDLLKIPPHKRKSAVKEICRLSLLYQAAEFSETNKKMHIPNNKYQLKPVVMDGFAIASDMFLPFGKYVWSFQPGSKTCMVCRKAPYRIVLVDVPIEETYRRLTDILTFEDKMLVKECKTNFVKMFLDNRPLSENIWRAHNSFEEILITNRDQYLAEGILEAAQLPGLPRPTRVVGLVGRRHVDGISSFWP